MIAQMMSTGREGRIQQRRIHDKTTKIIDCLILLHETIVAYVVNAREWKNLWANKSQVLLHRFISLPFCFRQEGYVFVVVCLFVCLLATLRKNFRTPLLREIFKEGWKWVIDQMFNFGGDPDHGYG